MKPAAWHGQLVAELFARGGHGKLPEIARVLGKSEKECERALKSAYCQEELARYQGALRRRLVESKVSALEKISGSLEEAAETLVHAMRVAKENDQVREMRECATALLAHGGLGPVKRVDKTTTHKIDQITDPVVLAKIIEQGEIPDELRIEGPTH